MIIAFWCGSDSPGGRRKWRAENRNQVGSADRGQGKSATPREEGQTLRSSLASGTRVGKYRGQYITAQIQGNPLPRAKGTVGQPGSSHVRSRRADDWFSASAIRAARERSETQEGSDRAPKPDDAEQECRDSHPAANHLSQENARMRYVNSAQRTQRFTDCQRFISATATTSDRHWRPSRERVRQSTDATERESNCALAQLSSKPMANRCG